MSSRFSRTLQSMFDCSVDQNGDTGGTKSSKSTANAQNV